LLREADEPHGERKQPVVDALRQHSAWRCRRR
jgi:hypothetical protein